MNSQRKSQSPTDNTKEREVQRQLPSVRRQYLILISISLVYFINVFALSSLNVAIPAIAKGLMAPAFLLNWISITFLLAMMMFTLPLAKIADRVGRRIIFIYGLLIFVIGCVIAATAQSIYILLAARYIQGLGSAVVFSSGLAIVALAFPMGRKGYAFGIVTAMVYLGMTAGPLLGGWILHHYDWRVLLASPVVIVLIALLGFMLAVNVNRKEPNAEKVDWLGFTLWSLALWMFFISISIPLSSFSVTLLVVAMVLFVVFVKQQLRSSVPLIYFDRLRKNLLFSRSILASIFSYAGNYSLVFLMSLYLQYILDLSALETGKIIAVQALVMALVSMVTGKIATYTGTFALAVTGCLFNIIAYLMMAQLTMESSIDFVIAALFLNGLGFGLFSAPNNIIAFDAVPIDRINMGSALVNLARNLGSTLGMAIVLLLTSFYLGQAIINDDNLQQLMSLFKVAMLFAMFFALIALVFSVSRKKHF